MKTIDAYASKNAKSLLESYPIQRRLVASHDVQIEIDYSRVCHTDLHFVSNNWGMSEYPVVPDHEIVGRVSHVEMIQMNDIKSAYKRLVKSDVKYRFVIEMKSL
jgi:D-arabinose 1-dehydrogenase-like Zn-dependent alcohol dehydrogenase